jgi:hypothetical protein
MAQTKRLGRVHGSKDVSEIRSLVAPRWASRLREEADSIDNAFAERLRALRLSDEA